MLDWLFGRGAEAAESVVVAAPAITGGFDSATILLLLVSMFLASFVAVTIGAAWLTGRVSKAKDETIRRVEGEAMEIKGFYQAAISRLVEGNALQTSKDVFQTFSQGTRPIGDLK